MSGTLCTIGDVVEDIVAWLDAPLSYGTDTAATIVRSRGGSAANVAVFAALAGASARFIGQAGEDDAGDRMIADLASNGVEVCVERGGRTGTIVVVVDPTGERTMLTDRGAATDLQALPAGAMDDVGVLHVPAYSLAVEPLASTTRLAVDLARAEGALISLDTSSVDALRTVSAKEMAAIAADFLFCSEEEFELLSDDPAACVVVKRGADPVLIVRSGTRREVALEAVAGVRDTTGAGDAFAAGFLTAVLDGATDADAARAGHRLAARVLAYPGATAGPQP